MKQRSTEASVQILPADELTVTEYVVGGKKFAIVTALVGARRFDFRCNKPVILLRASKGREEYSWPAPGDPQEQTLIAALVGCTIAINQLAERQTTKQ